MAKCFIFMVSRTTKPTTEKKERAISVWFQQINTLPSFGTFNEISVFQDFRKNYFISFVIRIVVKNTSEEIIKDLERKESLHL